MNECLVREIDVMALMHGIQNAQKTANETGIEQEVKISDYAVNEKEN